VHKQQCTTNMRNKKTPPSVIQEVTANKISIAKIIKIVLFMKAYLR